MRECTVRPAHRDLIYNKSVLTEVIGPISMEFQYKINPVVHLGYPGPLTTKMLYLKVLISWRLSNNSYHACFRCINVGQLHCTDNTDNPDEQDLENCSGPRPGMWEEKACLEGHGQQWQ